MLKYLWTVTQDLFVVVTLVTWIHAVLGRLYGKAGRRCNAAGIIVGVPLLYVGGLTSMMLLMDIDLKAGLMMAVLPFIPGDVIKALGAAFLGVKINKMLARQGGVLVQSRN